MNRFHLEIQYVPESVTLLNIVAQPAPYITNYMNYMASRYGMTPDERANKVVALLQEIEDAARAEFAKDLETVNALNALSVKKTELETLARQVAGETDREGLRRLMLACAASLRLTGADLMRESGYMLPQSREAKDFLQGILMEPPSGDFPLAEVWQLMESL